MSGYRARHLAGLTLLETVVVIGLFAFMMAALTGLYLSFTASAATTQALSSVNARALGTLALLRSDVADADAVLASHTYASGTTYSSATTTLALELPAVNGSGVPIASTYDYVAYYLSGTDIYRELDAAAGSSRVGGTTLIATGITSLAFTYDDVDPTHVRRVSLDLLVTAGVHTPITHEVRTTVYLRNRP